MLKWYADTLEKTRSGKIEKYYKSGKVCIFRYMRICICSIICNFSPKKRQELITSKIYMFSPYAFLNLVTIFPVCPFFKEFSTYGQETLTLRACFNYTM